MADEPRTPVAVRITRPYATEQEFLSRELETMTRTSVSLLGAPQKPQGVVLRFELVLTSGEPLLRGEGRVVGFKAASATMESALTLRFTRLDARSKALVDRAAAVREAKGRLPATPGAETPDGVATIRKPGRSSPGLDPAQAPSGEPFEGMAQAEAGPAAPIAPSVPPPPPSSSRTVIAHAPPAAPRLQEHEDHEDTTMAPQSAPPTSPELSDPPMSPRVGAPAGLGRERLLERLRERARDLKPEAVAAILARSARGDGRGDTTAEASSASSPTAEKRRRRSAP